MLLGLASSGAQETEIQRVYNRLRPSDLSDGQTSLRPLARVSQSESERHSDTAGNTAKSTCSQANLAESA